MDGLTFCQKMLFLVVIIDFGVVESNFFWGVVKSNMPLRVQGIFFYAIIEINTVEGIFVVSQPTQKIRLNSLHDSFQPI